MKKILRNNYLTTFSANASVTIIGLVTSIVLARSLGPEGRGEIAAALIWPSLLSYIANLGVPEATLYYASRPDSSVKSIYSNALFMSLLQSLLAILLTFNLVPSLLPSQNAKLIELSQFYLISIPFVLVSQVTISLLRSQLRIKITNLLHLIVPGGYFIGVVLLALTGNLEPENVVLCQLILAILSTISASFALVLCRVPLGIHVSFRMMRQLWSYGIKAHLGNLSSLANIRLDQALLAAWASPAQLGLYTIAVSISGLLVMIAVSINYVSSPVIARLSDRVDQLTRLRVSVQRIWFLSICCGAVMIIFMYPTISLVYGMEFVGAVWPAQILVAAAVFRGMKGVLTGGAQALDNPLLPSRAELVAGVFTVVALMLILPVSGIVGAAIVSLIAYALALFVMLHGLRKHHGMAVLSLFRIDEPARYFAHLTRSYLAAR